MSGPIHTGTATGPGGTSHTGGPVPTPRLEPIAVLMRTFAGTLREGTAHPTSPVALDAFIEELNVVHASHVPCWERALLLAGGTNQFIVSIVEVDTVCSLFIFLIFLFLPSRLSLLFPSCSLSLFLFSPLFISCTALHPQPTVFTPVSSCPLLTSLPPIPLLSSPLSLHRR